MHSRRRRTSLWLLVLVPLALLVAACGDDDDGDATDEASPEAVVIYSGRNENLVGPLLERFTEETGIPHEFRGGDSGELAAQLITEGDASPADVFFSQDAGALGALAAEGGLAELPQEILGRVPPEYRAVDDTWVGTSGRARVLVYDPAVVDPPPEGIDDILDEEWEGEIGYAPTNASWQSFVTGLRVVRGEDGARQWLEDFAALDPQPFENNVAVRNAVDDGEIAMGLVNHYYLYELIAEEGSENVTARNHFFAGGDPGGLVNVAGVGILGSSDHPEEARALVEFLLSEEAQTYFATETFEYPLVAGVAGPEGAPSFDQLDPPAIDLADLSSIEQTQELLAEVGLLTR